MLKLPDHNIQKHLDLGACVASIVAFLFWVTPALAHDSLPAGDFNGPRGTVEMTWKPKHIARVFSSGYGDSFGLETAAKEGFPVLETIDGRSCVDGSFFLFDVNDDYAFDVDEDIEMEILFDRTRSNGFWFGYDRNAVAETATEIWFPQSEERWHREVVKLDRARFANRGQGGSDFAISALDAMWPGIPGEDHRIVICDIVLKRPGSDVSQVAFGNLDLSISDAANGRPTSVRMGIYDSSGRMPLPSNDALTIHNYDDDIRQIFLRMSHATVTPWPSENRYIFYAASRYRARLPIGDYLLVVSKGPEYRVLERSFAISTGETLKMEIPMERWSDMPSQHWYSGDNHVHIARTLADNVSISGMMKAEDIHVTNLLQMGNPASTYFQQYGFGKSGRFVTGHHALISGVEDPRTAVRGHTISLNIETPVRNADAYLQYDKVFDAYRNQGGISGYAHIAGGLFNAGRGAALDVPLGAVDLLEIMQDGILATELWYSFLNLGFPLIPTAGSDFPYLGQPGAERNYVNVPGAFSPNGWFAALENGRTFVTNGPLMELYVNGEPMGASISAQLGDRVTIAANARLNPDIEALDRLELIIHGDVVKTAIRSGDGDTVSLTHELDLSRGMWIAARAYGVDQAAAHTAPVYVQIDDQGFWRIEKVPELATAMRLLLRELGSLPPKSDEELEPWETTEALNVLWQQQKTNLQERIKKADSVYESLLQASQ